MPSTGRDYWNERARRYGSLSVGYTDPVLYQYEEELRWAAFTRTCPIVPGMRVLDIGCGVGRWSARLAGLGCKVVGVDISAVMIRMAVPSVNVEYHVGAVQDLDFASASFDLIVSITVLQHITERSEFERALDNTRRMLKKGGHMAVLEYAPRRVRHAGSGAEYMCWRGHQEWIDAFKSHGYELVRETGVQFIGYWLYVLNVQRLDRLLPGPGLIDLDGNPTNWIGRALRRLAWSADLTLARLAFARRFSDVRCMLFRKSGD